MITWISSTSEIGQLRWYLTIQSLIAEGQPLNARGSATDCNALPFGNGNAPLQPPIQALPASLSLTDSSTAQSRTKPGLFSGWGTVTPLEHRSRSTGVGAGAGVGLAVGVGLGVDVGIGAGVGVGVGASLVCCCRVCFATSVATLASMVAWRFASASRVARTPASTVAPTSGVGPGCSAGQPTSNAKADAVSKAIAQDGTALKSVRCIPLPPRSWLGNEDSA